MTEYNARIQTETARLAALAEDLTVPVPTCPGWTIAELITHVGRLHRWAVHVLRGQVQERIWPRQVPSGLAEGESGDAAWLTAGAAELLETLRVTDPELAVWTWGPDKRASWWSRRMFFELVVHRVVAELALGIDPVIPAEVAIDGVEEYLHNLSYAAWVTRPLAELGVEGATIHLHANDGPGEWTITQGPGGKIEWAAGHAKGDVAAQGSAEDLLLMLYGRRSPAALTVHGDGDLLGRWLTTTAI
ncbi:maleylpyruvate isomerase family mycothiol-dependent enzyme [Nonomuraea sp. K274]|uniref:Maleylpyruvate isomerase family mycothiol-dependent enzyme n=1 Tax=Nonomuraea cypriaca TaxID=1187855 RepID=A0A931AEN8_9ACTN|nr:maleylpyruvate isomerase family mycothiol-dependent enzyme [Nonomuraea cypriaca]MBF8187862.1 maleylpyruvate isomerase family mycothiol-dependent enzyme [Nonomuraea cypriaca]